MCDKIDLDPHRCLDDEDAACLCTAQDLLPRFLHEHHEGSEMFGDSTWVLNNRQMARLMEIAILALNKEASSDQIRRGNFVRGGILAEIGTDLMNKNRRAMTSVD
tara:strand:- start:5319 stop:5633 length:315 start_codon:yes stop_codon:yes gene_type:complete